MRAPGTIRRICAGVLLRSAQRGRVVQSQSGGYAIGPILAVALSIAARSLALRRTSKGSGATKPRVSIQLRCDEVSITNDSGQIQGAIGRFHRQSGVWPHVVQLKAEVARALFSSARVS